MMDLSLLKKINDFEWQIPQHGKMLVPGVIFASEQLILDMDMKVYEQLSNVATLPGIVSAAYAMPDAHWGYGFPIGGVAAFDPDDGGVISAGGVGFDISCGVRLLSTGLTRDELESVKVSLADALFTHIPAGVGSRSGIHLTIKQLDDMMRGGAQWAVKQGYGEAADLERIEDRGCVEGAIPDFVSEQAKKRQKNEMGTLGSGNHYLEVQEVRQIYCSDTATALNLHEGDIVVSIHCGSRGLGHQIGTDYLRSMVIESQHYGIRLADRELACAPIHSKLGENYLGAMRAGINCALANREIITHFMRNVFQDILPRTQIDLIYDVSHNTCKEEFHEIDGKKKRLFVHRKGATRALGPGHPQLPKAVSHIGQPVIIGGSMGTGSYVLAGVKGSEHKSFSSACHGAGRAMSRHQAMKKWNGKDIVDKLAQQGILIRSGSYRGVAEEAPGAYKDVHSIVDAAEMSGLAKKVAKLIPIICVKG
ncbi:TPA: RNA-splicing ligase RtcB [Legionella pneumophila subsp. pneumophila]|nr:RNA-splicing ligase RtcB [Legionella pneumophila subsp. pneumophila]HAT9260520.1 RNA-splicing ligase RtcB [Legionella pneumophila subsp. pneumophila]HAT9282689.1 RNA-splicing ligase RtcB [Legionella pneumophila subsp. pneumophila]HAT9288617.1 RNA-splicing ligase RtcB [Legionella pneumophila subsp. pneumophila]HAT9305650.1 RNA-splicing ligase RtcB [Legionella pneumophila subsp. pneumophila]